MKHPNSFSLIIFITLTVVVVNAVAQNKPLEIELLNAHNYWRSEFSIPAFTWNDDIAKGAQMYAEELASLQCRLRHDMNNNYGENLYGIYGTTVINGKDPVESWANERFDYDFETNTCKKVCGHFTQLIWEKSKEVGCGVAKGSSCVVVVCRYNPPGNYVGQRPIPNKK